MRSHTVAAEGGAAAVIKEEDSYDKHFHDTVAVVTGYVNKMWWNTSLNILQWK